MANQKRENRLNGLFPLSYMGVIPVAPQNFIRDTRAPTTTDSQNFYIGDLWLDTSSDTAQNGYVPPTIANLWILVSLDRHVATWINFLGAAGTVISLSGNTGTNPVFAIAGNIKVFGDGIGINISGDGVNTLTASLVGGGVAAQSFPTDSGTATPNASGVLNIITSQVTNAAGITTLFTGSGNTVLFKNTDANGNVFFGKSSGKSGVSGSRNSGFSQNSLGSITSGSDNFAGGFGSLAALTTGSDSVALGSGALLNLVSGSANIAIGFGSGSAYTGAESGNTLIGHTGIVGSSNQIIISLGSGGNRWIHNVGGTFVGNLSGNFTYSGTGGMSGFGENSLGSVTTAIDCTCMGQQSGSLITTGSGNTLGGKDSGHTITTGQNNTLWGRSAGFNGVVGLVTGSNNILIGNVAGSGYTGAESDNIIIGSGNAGVNGESQNIRIGFGTSASLKCFIDGIRGITTGVNDAVAVLIDSAGQLGTTSSSIRFKQNVLDMNDESNNLMNLRPITFEYKSHPGIMHFGLIAEEVKEQMPRLVVHDELGLPLSVKYHELPVLLLNELQKLQRRIEFLENKLEDKSA